MNLRKMSDSILNKSKMKKNNEINFFKRGKYSAFHFLLPSICYNYYIYAVEKLYGDLSKKLQSLIDMNSSNVNEIIDWLQLIFIKVRTVEGNIFFLFMYRYFLYLSEINIYKCSIFMEVTWRNKSMTQFSSDKVDDTNRKKTL